jgi:zinc transport system ATP-binding protein
VNDASEELTPALDFDHVTFGYQGSDIIRNATFRVANRDFAAIVGPNGSGKTTLLKLILGLLTPRSGRIHVLGGSPVSTRSRIGYMPQQASLDSAFPVSVRDVVLMGRLRKTRRFGPYSAVDQEQADHAIDSVECSHLRDRAFADLSGGERQRVLIARALASEPEFLILDEPTAGLDAAVEGRFYELLSSLNECMTILVVSHNLTFVSSHVRKVICVGRDSFVHVHATRELTDDLMQSVYGGRVRMVLHNQHDDCHHHEDGEDCEGGMK